MSRKVTVLGAGIVGICCARFLQHSGYDVTLIDRDEPAQQTSFGNLGMLCSVEHALPLASMDVLRRVPSMLLNPDSPLAIRWQYLPKLFPWLTRFVVNATETRRIKNAQALATLMCDNLPAYDRLSQITPEIQPFIRKLGSLDVYQQQSSFAKGARERKRLRSLGVTVEELNGDDIRQLEPSIARDYDHGVYFPNCGHCLDPHGMAIALFDGFVKGGGHFLKTEVTSIESRNQKACRLHSGDTASSVDALVLTTGAWSKKFAAQLGMKVPLDTERGYHTMVHNFDAEISRPIGDGETDVGLTQMNGGLRIGGTVELAGLQAPPNFDRASAFYQRSRRLIPALEQARDVEISQWMGFRPTLPDYLPVLGASPAHTNVWFAFGHQHLGLSLAAKTGELTTALIDAQVPDVDLYPFRINRF